jgi:hypothetical protein
MWLIVIAGALLRFALISHNWPSTNSDEAVMGLMAKHILVRGEHPIFYYGQAYMGPLEAYVGAILFAIFGVSTLTLRLGLILFFAIFVVCMYYLTRLLYNRQLALVTVGLLSLGSVDMLLHQLRGIGGYPEIVAFAALIFFIASHLALTADQAQQANIGNVQRRRWLEFAVLGLLAGLAIWDDQLILPWVFLAAVLLFLFCRHELRRVSGVCVLFGLLIGASPIIYYNITAPTGQSSIEILAALQHAGAAQIAQQHITLLSNISGTLLVGLPAITGFNPTCAATNLPFLGQATPQMLLCTALQGGWTLGYFVLWVSAACLAGYIIWRHWQQWKQNHDHAFTREERDNYVIQWARLLLLLGGILTMLSYITSPSSALVPGPTSRYLICVQLTIPAILWPLWNGFNRQKIVMVGGIRPLLILRIALLLFIELMFLLGTIRTFNQGTQDGLQQEQALIQYLESVGATRVYADYWNCYNLVFQSNENILCTPLGDQLQPAQDRYPPYTRIIQSTYSPAYVFSKGAPQVALLEHDLRTLHIPYKYYAFADYVVYEPNDQLHKGIVMVSGNH